MVVGDNSYQLNLSRIAFAFRGAVGMDYLQNAGVRRVKELTEHSKTIAEEIKANG